MNHRFYMAIFAAVAGLALGGLDAGGAARAVTNALAPRLQAGKAVLQACGAEAGPDAQQPGDEARIYDRLKKGADILALYGPRSSGKPLRLLARALASYVQCGVLNLEQVFRMIDQCSLAEFLLNSDYKEVPRDEIQNHIPGFVARLSEWSGLPSGFFEQYLDTTAPAYRFSHSRVVGAAGTIANVIYLSPASGRSVFTHESIHTFFPGIPMLGVLNEGFTQVLTAMFPDINQAEDYPLVFKVYLSEMVIVRRLMQMAGEQGKPNALLQAYVTGDVRYLVDVIGVDAVYNFYLLSKIDDPTRIMTVGRAILDAVGDPAAQAAIRRELDDITETEQKLESIGGQEYVLIFGQDIRGGMGDRFGKALEAEGKRFLLVSSTDELTAVMPMLRRHPPVAVMGDLGYLDPVLRTLEMQDVQDWFRRVLPPGIPIMAYQYEDADAGRRPPPRTIAPGVWIVPLLLGEDYIGNIDLFIRDCLTVLYAGQLGTAG